MYAVVKTGGKEYRVSKGDLIRVEKLEGKPFWRAWPGGTPPSTTWRNRST